MQQLIAFDERLAITFSGFIASQPILAKLAIVLGVGLVYLVPIIVFTVWFVVSRKIALRAVLTGLLAWFGLAKLVSALVDRVRPADSLIGVKELIFHRPDNSFPSDHTALLMAMAISFYLTGQRQWSHVLLILSLLTGLARVGIGVHYPGDILVGYLIGVIAALLIEAIKQPIESYILDPLVQLARKIRL